MVEGTPPASDPRAGLFDIVVEFAGAGWTPSLQAAVLAAAARLETVVLADLPDVLLRWPDGTSRAVDDLLVTAALEPMDGPGGALGSAFLAALRPGSLLPAMSVLRFDAADAGWLEASGGWYETALHEMLHGLGFGILWVAKGLLAPGPAGVYVGPAGMAEYAALGGVGPVPVEPWGGATSATAHWAESVFDDELMTGWGGAAAPLSPLSLASLADLGYGLAPRAAWAADVGYALPRAAWAADTAYA